MITRRHLIATMEGLGLCGGCSETNDTAQPARRLQTTHSLVAAKPAPKVRDDAIHAVMERVNDALKDLDLVRASAWGPPPGHPDLTATVAADRIHALLSELAGDAAVARQSAAFRRTLGSAVEVARDFRSAINCSSMALKERHYNSMVRTCYICHNAFRD